MAPYLQSVNVLAVRTEISRDLKNSWRDEKSRL